MDVPANQRLWNMLVTQAKAKFPKWPSLPASNWVHRQYVEKGGQFVKSEKARTATKYGRQNEDKDVDKDGKKDGKNIKKGEK